jgi:hypothetical protein
VVSLAGPVVTPVDDLNPMWDQILNMQRLGRLDYSDSRGIIREIPGAWGAPRQVDRTLRAKSGYRAELSEIMLRYSPVPSHPETVDKLISLVPQGKIVTALVGTAYWPWLLRRRGLKVVAYDERKLFGPKTWLDKEPPPVQRVNSTWRDIELHQEPLLLIVPDERRAVRVLRRYIGPRCIYVGMNPPKAHTLREEFDLWDLVEEWQPVRFFTEPCTLNVFERRTNRGVAPCSITSETMLLRLVPQQPEALAS